MKFTRHTLRKLEEVLEACGYLIRYEKGNFSSSSCRLHDNRVIVVNKFLNVEQRNLVLIDFLFEAELDSDAWDDKQKKFIAGLSEWKKKKLQLED